MGQVNQYRQRHRRVVAEMELRAGQEILVERLTPGMFIRLGRLGYREVESVKVEGDTVTVRTHPLAGHSMRETKFRIGSKAIVLRD